MASDNESWLINIGAAIIDKMSAPNQPALTETEATIYCLWVVDYSIRNSGTLSAMEDLYPEALVELHRFARKRRCDRLSSIFDPEGADDEDAFCEDYRHLFEDVCAEIRALYEGTVPTSSPTKPGPVRRSGIGFQ